MKSIINRLLCLYFLIFVTLFASPDKERYTGAISYSEKRIVQGKIEFSKGAEFPNQWTVFFKERTGNYAVFYDLNGHELHFKYKTNKFDVDGEAFASFLVEGNAYSVKGELLGILFFPQDARGRRKPIPDFKKSPVAKAELSDLQTIPVFKLVEYKEVFSKQILH